MIHLGDVCKIKGDEIEPCFCLVYGSPCQDVSVAGKRAGLKHEENGDDETTRSGLFFESIRIIKEMRNADIRRGRSGVDVRCRFALLENVPGLLSSNNGEDFRAVLEETARVADPTVSVPRPDGGKWAAAGAIIGNGFSLAWRCHDARFWGIPQRRRRIALLADFNGNLAPEIMFERDTGTQPRSEVQPLAESLSGDSEPRVETGEETPGSLENCARTTGAYTFRNHYDGRVLNEESLTLDTCGGGGGIDSPTSSQSGDESAVAFSIGSMNSEGMKSDNPATGFYETETGRTLDNNGGNPAGYQGGIAIVERESTPITRQAPADEVMAFKLGNSAESRSIGLEVEVSPTLNSECGGNKPAVCYNEVQITSPVNASNPKPGNPAPTLNCDAARSILVQGDQL